MNNDENKNIDKEQENKKESWFKNVGLKPNLLAAFELLSMH